MYQRNFPLERGVLLAKGTHFWDTLFMCMIIVIWFIIKWKVFSVQKKNWPQKHLQSKVHSWIHSQEFLACLWTWVRVILLYDQLKFLKTISISISDRRLLQGWMTFKKSFKSSKWYSNKTRKERNRNRRLLQGWMTFKKSFNSSKWYSNKTPPGITSCYLIL